MVAILTREELAAALQNSVDNASADLVIKGAQGLITEVIGEHEPWPATAWTIALAVCVRAYSSPEGAREDASDGSRLVFNHPLYEVGLYLTDREEQKLKDWLKAQDPEASNPASSFGTIRLGSGYPPIGPCPDTRWPIETAGWPTS